MPFAAWIAATVVPYLRDMRSRVSPFFTTCVVVRAALVCWVFFFAAGCAFFSAALGALTLFDEDAVSAGEFYS